MSEKKVYNIKDFVVYPKHGVGKIIAVEKAKIGQIDIQFYKIFIEKEKIDLDCSNKPTGKFKTNCICQSGEQMYCDP